MDINNDSEHREGQPNLTDDIDRFAYSLLEHARAPMTGNISSVNKQELRFLNTDFPQEEDFYLPFSFYEHPQDGHRNSLLSYVMTKLFSDKHNAIDPQFTVYRKGLHGFLYDETDAIYFIDEISAQGWMKINDKIINFHPSKKILRVYIQDADSWNDGRNPQDSATYYYRSSDQFLNAQYAHTDKYPYRTGDVYHIPLIDNTKLDPENLQNILKNISIATQE